MWNTATAHAPGQQQTHDHNTASQAAFAAAGRAKVAKVLKGQGAAPSTPSLGLPAQPAQPGLPGGFQSALAGQVGAPISAVHNAIDTLTQQNRFTPAQGAALKAHTGHLIGAAGASTQNDILASMVAKSAPGAAPGQGLP